MNTSEYHEHYAMDSLVHAQTRRSRDGEAKNASTNIVPNTATFKQTAKAPEKLGYV
jgi:hypothetical protein